MPSDILSALGQGTIKGVTVRSTVTPPFRYDPWAGGEAPPSPIMGWLRPTFDIETVAGPVTLAPYGEPHVNLAPYAAVAAIVMVVGIVGIIGFIARKLP